MKVRQGIAELCCVSAYTPTETQKFSLRVAAYYKKGNFLIYAVDFDVYKDGQIRVEHDM
jgi:hypothetical protein